MSRETGETEISNQVEEKYNLTGIISVYNNNIKIKGVMTFKIKGTKNMQLTLNIKTFVRNFP